MASNYVTVGSDMIITLNSMEFQQPEFPDHINLFCCDTARRQLHFGDPGHHVEIFANAPCNAETATLVEFMLFHN